MSNRLPFFAPSTQGFHHHQPCSHPDTHQARTCSWCLAELKIPAKPGQSHTICERHKREMLSDIRGRSERLILDARQAAFPELRDSECGIVCRDTIGGAAKETLAVGIVLLAMGFGAVLAMVVF